MDKILEHPWVKEYKKDLDGIRHFDIIEEKLGVDRLYVVTGALAVLFLGMLGAFGGSPVANLVGFVYPTYKSYKALKSEKKSDDTQWLTYWVVYSFFIVFEGFSDVLMSWIPLYYIAKIAFLWFCMSPTFQGSSIIFHKFIEPFLDSTSNTLDEVEEDVREAVEDVVEDIQHEITEKGTAFVVNHVLTSQSRRSSGSTPRAGSEGSDVEVSYADEVDDEDLDYIASTCQDPPVLSDDSDDTYHPKST